ncbi:hypothetical protein DM02DRAFT_662264 [Periconia macrospinosa]|uniref:Uncharacterized protein n=1 Tax=Periconia macrospinosa TaxID=97972 RepID=A0A2V1D7K5_9PLEO|nr:hypothetical protein DM02DRAFT_662264 [Periconia macrospinosa]
MRVQQLVAFCLSVATLSLADPSSNGIMVSNFAAYDGYVYVKCEGGHRSHRNGPVRAAGWTRFDWGDLSGEGFQEGENCWMVVDVVSGKDGHESGQNFNLAKSGITGTYALRGGPLNPEWDRMFS